MLPGVAKWNSVRATMLVLNMFERLDGVHHAFIALYM